MREHNFPKFSVIKDEVIAFTARHTAEITTYYAAVITINITSEITIYLHMYITAVISEVGQAQDIVT